MLTEKELVKISNNTAKEFGYKPSEPRLISSFPDKDPLIKYLFYYADNVPAGLGIGYARFDSKSNINLRNVKILTEITTPTLGEIGKDLESALCKRYHVAELHEGSPHVIVLPEDPETVYPVVPYVQASFHRVDKGVKRREIIPKAMRATVFLREEYEAIVKEVMKGLVERLPIARPISSAMDF